MGAKKIKEEYSTDFQSIMNSAKNRLTEFTNILLSAQQNENNKVPDKRPFKYTNKTFSLVKGTFGNSEIYNDLFNNKKNYKNSIYIIKFNDDSETLFNKLLKFRKEQDKLSKGNKKATPKENSSEYKYDVPFYIGKSQKNLHNRLNQHFGSPAGKVGALRCSDWIKDDKKYNVTLEILTFSHNLPPELLFILESSARLALNPLFGKQ